MKTVAYIILLFFIANSAKAQIRQIACVFSHSPRGYECRLPDFDLSNLDEFEIVSGPHIPPQNDNTVLSFMSTNNNFLEFPTTHLARFPNLQQIHITGSRIPEIPALAVFNRPALVNLDLRSNFITRIDTQAFQGTPNINTLNLQFNRIRTIDNDAFAQFSNLQNLDLSFNLLERVPANALINNRALSMIDFNSNRISHINQTFFSNVPSLISFAFNINLCYSGSFFSLNIPANFNDMINRLTPCFENTALSVSCEFGFQFAGVEFDNRYTCLLRNVEAYDYDKTINLGGVHLAGQNNANVHQAWVDASNVRFMIRSFFTTFVNLQGVHISASNLQVLQPNAFQGATNLRYLSILLNNLRVLEDNSFQGATNLAVIHLWHNNVEEIRQDAFAGLTQLRELHILGGSLRTIPPYTFTNLINLEIVEFSQNYIEVIDSRWFENSPLLRQMAFNDNEVYAVHPSIVDRPALTSLGLLRNRCVDAYFTISNQNRDQVRAQLNPCFEGYPTRNRTLRLELEGEMNVWDEDENLVLAI